MSEDDAFPVVPQDTRTDQTLELASVIATMVPWLGGPFGAVLSGVSFRRKWDRIEDVVNSIGVELREFKSDVAEQYVKTEEFQDLLESALRRAAEEREPAKRRVYRDFILDVIRRPGDDPFDVHLDVLRVIEQLSEDDLRLLRAIDQGPSRPSYSAASPLGVLAMRLGAATLDQIQAATGPLQVAISRLQGLRLLGAVRWSELRGANHAEDLRQTITPLGRRVLEVMRHR